MRDTVTPPLTRSARIVAVLQRLDNADTDATVIEHQAHLINGAMLHMIAAERASGHDIGHDDGGAYALPRDRTVGLVRELRDLHRACRKAIAGKLSQKDWTTAWAALPERTKRLVWKPLLTEWREPEQRNGDWVQRELHRAFDRSTLAMGFETEGFAVLAPRPAVVLPAIEAERAKIKATPRPQARTRTAEEAAAIEAIRAAYRAITRPIKDRRENKGERFAKGGRVIREGKLVGRLIALGREIDAMFGTALFAEKDSRRLR